MKKTIVFIFSPINLLIRILWTFLLNLNHALSRLNRYVHNFKWNKHLYRLLIVCQVLAGYCIEFIGFWANAFFCLLTYFERIFIDVERYVAFSFHAKEVFDESSEDQHLFFKQADFFNCVAEKNYSIQIGKIYFRFW